MNTYGPYSPVRQAGDLYFVSGQVGIEPISKRVAANISAQTHQALKNLQQILKTVGLTPDDIVKTTVFLKNMTDFSQMNEVYVTYFKKSRPARACLAVSALPNLAGKTELLVEIEATAYRSEKVGIQPPLNKRIQNTEK